MGIMNKIIKSNEYENDFFYSGFVGNDITACGTAGFSF
jgi:hypothetical protein